MDNWEDIGICCENEKSKRARIIKSTKFNEKIYRGSECKGDGTKAYKYCITEFGTKTMLKYRKRLESGFSLNLSTVEKEDEHIGIVRAGVEAGMSYRDALLKMKERKDS